MRYLVCLLTLAPLTLAADHEKSYALAEDEIAVLADSTSPDHEKLLERLDGKLLKFTARVYWQAGGVVAGKGTEDQTQIRVPGKRKGDPTLALTLEWVPAPSSDAAKKTIKKNFPEGTPLTLYGRASFSVMADGGKHFRKGPLVNASTDPKLAADPPKAKDREPPKLKR